MKILQLSLFSVLERFSDRREAIRSRFVKSETFKAICEDYKICLETLRHWRRFEGEGAEQRQQEYSDLLKELEEEILRNLDGTGQ